MKEILGVICGAILVFGLGYIGYIIFTVLGGVRNPKE